LFEGSSFDGGTPQLGPRLVESLSSGAFPIIQNRSAGGAILMEIFDLHPFSLDACERNDLATVVSRIFRIFGCADDQCDNGELVLHGNASKPFAMVFITVGEDFQGPELAAAELKAMVLRRAIVIK
jgi:hypothetical protein